MTTVPFDEWLRGFEEELLKQGAPFGWQDFDSADLDGLWKSGIAPSVAARRAVRGRPPRPKPRAAPSGPPSTPVAPRPTIWPVDAARFVRGWGVFLKWSGIAVGPILVLGAAITGGGQQHSAFLGLVNIVAVVFLIAAQWFFGCLVEVVGASAEKYFRSP